MRLTLLTSCRMMVFELFMSFLTRNTRWRVESDIRQLE
jgi:hypothetical protein